MLFMGREPNIASLYLDKAGVAAEHGRIVADECMRSSTPHVFAAGDCIGPHSSVRRVGRTNHLGGVGLRPMVAAKLYR
jgi:pyruvate/2-oxoglutarate dehydrogenase complex dihydrolipoamide dehydrogenase (E3) component